MSVAAPDARQGILLGLVEHLSKIFGIFGFLCPKATSNEAVFGKCLRVPGVC